jgi:hypothetical protein
MRIAENGIRQSSHNSIRQLSRIRQLSHIGYLAVCAYNADLKRLEAKESRRVMRSKNLCINETCDYVNGEPENFRPQPCWMDKNLGINEWCDRCNKVQPFHLDYIKSARECNSARGKLTNAIKKYRTNSTSKDEK